MVCNVQILDCMFLFLIQVIVFFFSILRSWYLLFCTSIKPRKPGKRAYAYSLVFTFWLHYTISKKSANIASSNFQSIECLYIVTLVQTEEKFHQTMGSVRCIVHQNRDDSSWQGVWNVSLHASISRSLGLSFYKSDILSLTLNTLILFLLKM